MAGGGDFTQLHNLNDLWTVAEQKKNSSLREYLTRRGASRRSVNDLYRGKTCLFQAEPALMYDSVQVFAVGLRTLEQSHALRPANISCEMEHPWDGGLSLINYINSVSFTTFTRVRVL